MAKLVSKRTTTTVTEEVELIPAVPGEMKGHRFMKVGGYGTYRGADGKDVGKPQINLNAKWLAEAGFDVGEQIDVEVHENELVIRKLCVQA
ncbi:SymE family type I addiction module toxin [Chordicoccus furentiruminis]|uniref:SymE family type I addiction module toxin n=1 Tax=Chordicoccus furentiruminis TaxID=2709410 RepID=UPI0023A7E0AD|nr:SymE family type I addiction module toxin [Chordicoccus furentiruminis]